MDAYLALAKGAKGAACAQLISDALSAPGVFVFSELLEMPNVAELAKNPSHAGSLRLLQLFAYGTYGEYAAEAAALPPLSPTQTKKLKQLSIVTLSQSSKVLPYNTLQSALSIDNVRELEDLIIDTMYQSIIEGKLDQKRMCLRVENAMGRDLKPGQTKEMLDTLTSWLETSNRILSTIDGQLESVNQSDSIYLSQKDAYDKTLELAKQEAGKTSTIRSFPHDLDGFDPMDEDSRRFAGGGKRQMKGRRK
ncbi:hypothetical protein BDR26DRAFT_817222 [Obelidium mucronatum]|nr:hypothetical protein BDR26DRAFT_817222 [Obelidium mucronatum]